MKASDLTLHPNNPRVIDKKAFAKLKASIKRDPKFMEARPIIIDDENVILGGNQRFRACQALGLKKIPDAWIKQMKGLSDEEKTRFLVIDNGPKGMTGSWDMDALEGLVDGIEGIEMDDFEVDLSETDFTYVPNTSPDESDTQVTPDDVEKARAGVGTRLDPTKRDTYLRSEVTCPECACKFEIDPTYNQKRADAK